MEQNVPGSSLAQKAVRVVKEWHMMPRFQVTGSGVDLDENAVGLVKPRMKNLTILFRKLSAKLIHLPLNRSFCKT